MQHDTTASSSSRLPAWLIVLGSLTAIGPLSIDMYLPSLPIIADDLGSTTADVQLTLAVFLVGMGLGQLAYGPLSDRFGRKPPLYAGLAIYIVASVGCAVVGSVPALTAWRFLQALGGSGAIVISRAVVRDRTTTREAARAFSLLMLVMGLAPIVAPLLGGAMLAIAGWRSIFWLLAVTGLLMLAAVRLVLTETVSRQDAEPLRLGQVIRSYWQLLSNRLLMLYSLYFGLAFGGLFAYISASPYVLIELYHVPPQHFGWLFGLNAFGLIAATQFNARLLRSYPPEVLLARAAWVPPLAAALTLLPLLLGIHSLLLLMMGLFVFLSSLGFISPNTNALALAQVDRAEAGSAAALMGTLQFLLGTAASIVVSVWHTPSALPLIGTMLICGIGALHMQRKTNAAVTV